MRTLSIKRKLTLIITGISTVALLLASAGFVVYELAVFKTSTRQDLSTLAEITGSQSTGALTFEDNKNATEILNGLAAKKHIIAAALYDSRGQVFAVYPERSGLTSVPANPEPNVCRFEPNFVILFKRIQLNGEVLGTIYLKSDLKERQTRLQLCGLIVTALFVLCSAVSFILSSWLQRIVTRPILHLVQTAKMVSGEKNYSLRAKKQAEDELGQLIDGFNEMLGQIQQRDAELQAAQTDLEVRVQERTRELQEEIIERESAETALQQQFTRISLLNQITYAVAARQDFESMLLVVLQQLEEHLPMDCGSAYFFNPESTTLEVMVRGPKSRPIADKLQIPSTIPLTETPFHPCLEGEMVYLPDGRDSKSTISSKMAEAGFLSMIAAPLVVENEVFGLLVLIRRPANAFSAAEREFIRGLSAHVALALHQAQLYNDLQKAYDELRLTQQTVMQQERLKALGQMASGIAHDINNALSPIVGFADLLAHSETALTPNGKKYLLYIKTAGEDIAHIVAGLREFYRHREQGEALLPLKLNAVAQQVIDMTRPRWRDIPQGRGITVDIRTDLDPHLPDFPGIESEIREALTNLIINAVDATPNGGTILIRTRLATRKFAAHNQNSPADVVLEVSDTGIGMSEQTRKQCLEPFFSTKGQRGTGLGLAMVYGVVERHEGKIEIESELGKGTTFRLIFPVRKIAGNSAVSPDNEPAIKPLRMLCIDDEPLLRELLKDLLERDGHKVEVADNGPTGIELFRKAARRSESFDLVITDLGMPYFDGRQVAKVLKQESPSTPIIMLTGWGAFMKEEGDRPAQVDGVLSKPPRLEELRDTLRRIMEQRDSNGKAAINA
ncbi:MAG: ATP-binding protein [Verrucomicrobiota bacterium]